MCWGTALFYTWNVEAVDADAADVDAGDGLNIDWCDWDLHGDAAAAVDGDSENIVVGVNSTVVAVAADDEKDANKDDRLEG